MKLRHGKTSGHWVGWRDQGHKHAKKRLPISPLIV
jgi:hypothetical protein